jgi:hypothetical protein
MNVGQSFLEFVGNVLGEEQSIPAQGEVDLEEILSPLADDQDVYELMASVPEEQINTVLSFVMNPESAGA